ncbi:nitrate reductase [Dickeya dianthicola]|uniref:nitrate reductase n=3 Tax=Dickeya dianthicola TaxID=204039 RepID=UPI00039F517A|nr:nitrate reductase [Dickeya dianthicola]MBT1428772.1 nitrate reductase [Dickeya dianthicola]MBT1460238.1 nitrate reductase [Dickeya dianthicola]MBT1460279.1 nitrate reductase [Dickeya dianthicola]MBT1489477.1 nitrate reductase [Dickeya dianthicola]MCI4032152.1 nitrate reductase [Dickeya dianthicola]
MNGCRTTCPYCGVGCGVIATPQPDGRVTIEGDSRHPANLGRLCVKGSALGDTLDLQGRLLWPLVDGHRVSWDQALDRVAQSLGDIIAQHGPQAVAFYGSGQLLTEDYYVANKLMKGFIGSANMDTNSRLCMASAVVGYKRALGADAVPCNYEDIEQADLVVLVGSNTAWAHPVVYQRLVQAKQQRPHMRVVVIDPRHTATCDAAELHLPLAPGSDAGLFNGLLRWLAQRNATVPDGLSGVEAALATADDWTVERVAEFCQLDSEDVACFYQWFADTDKVVTLYSQGINQSSSGSDKCNAIINVHLFSGRIGRAGCGPFSITGQPNAMGGREVGGLANQLAAHMGFSPQAVDRVGRFWGSDRVAPMPGLMAVDLFRAIEAGQVKAVWIMGTNPVVSMPEADRVRQALLRCPLVIVSDVMRHTDTADCAHVLLPALAWGEKDGTVTNSERRISRQRAFLPAPGEAKADWWILSQVAQRMGFGAAFDYRHPAQIFREHAALSGFENQGQRAFNISALATLSDEQWQQLTPVQWPVTANAGDGTGRLYSDGRCWHPDGKARLLAITPQLPVNPPSSAYPLVLNTGRVRDQWHTMTRTGKAPRLMRHLPEPYCDLHPQDALNAGVHDGELVRISAASGWMLARAQVQRGQQRGSVFVPMHWNRQFSAQARADSLVAAVTDPYSGQPESKQARVRIQRWPAVWFGELFVRGDVTTPDCGYWSRIAADGVSHYTIAGEQTPDRWLDWLARQYGLDGVDYQQAQGDSGLFHAVGWLSGQVAVALYIDVRRPALARETILAAFASPPQQTSDRLALLAGCAPQGEAPQGATICSCFAVGEQRIIEAIRQGCHNVAQLGEQLQCGTNCGSCVPELKALLQQYATPDTLRRAG